MEYFELKKPTRIDFLCPECAFRFSAVIENGIDSTKWNYCANCGLKMDTEPQIVVFDERKII